MITLEDVISRLRKECDALGGQTAWADKHNVSAAYVSDVLRNGRKPGPAILKGLGLRLVERYERE